MGKHSLQQICPTQLIQQFPWASHCILISFLTNLSEENLHWDLQRCSQYKSSASCMKSFWTTCWYPNMLIWRERILLGDIENKALTIRHFPAHPSIVYTSHIKWSLQSLSTHLCIYSIVFTWKKSSFNKLHFSWVIAAKLNLLEFPTVHIRVLLLSSLLSVSGITLQNCHLSVLLC